MILDTATTAGDCSLQWAPNASDTENQTLLTTSDANFSLDTANEVCGIAHTAAASGSPFVMDMDA